MEKDKQYLGQAHESLKHFDVLSSVDLFRYDLQTAGAIHPETWQRVADEELSYVAEGLNNPLHTEFTLQERDGMLVYFHNGQWAPYERMLEKGLVAAEQARSADYRKQILVDMAEADLRNYQAFRQLKPGERMAWFSPFDDTSCEQYGEEFMNSLGFQAQRRMGFLYEASRDDNGNITLKTQSVDNSNLPAFTAAMEAAHDGAELHEMLAVYDAVLEEQTGEMHYAGRLAESVRQPNTWQFIMRQSDLINFFMEEMVMLAKQVNLSRSELETAKKRLTYGVWAAFKERAEERFDAAMSPGFIETNAFAPTLRQEIEQSLIRTLMKGDRLLGCGGEIKFAIDDVFNMNPGDAFNKLFGREDSEESAAWDWKPGICRVSDCPTRPGKTKVGPCSVCRTCQKHFDKGLDPVKLYARNQKPIVEKEQYEWAA